jgi:recombination protein RecA
MTEDRRQHAIRVKLARMAVGAFDSIATGLAFGSFPRGSIVELFGPPGCGKTSVALAVIAHWQKAGGAAAWLDADHTFDPSYAAQLGVAVESLPVVQPETAEQAFAMLGQLAASSAVELLVVDSAAALAPALELETALGESGPGLQSRVLASGLRKLAQVLSRAGATAVFLNQTRTRSHQEEASAGGPSLKLYAALRIALEAVPGRDGAGRARFRLLKNKAGEPFREGELRWISTGKTGKELTEGP